MSKVDFKPGNMLYPLPVVMVSVGDMEAESNIITIAWTGTINSDPPMISISVRKERHSYDMIVKNQEFCVNVTNRDLTFATDLCGVKSGKDVDKWELAKLTKGKCSEIKAPLIVESPVNIECKVKNSMDLGTHVMFIGEVVAVHVNGELMDDKNVFHFNDCDPIAYSHGKYYTLGEELGKFGYSVKKN